MISARRMAMVDRNAAALGVPRKQLMESSGSAVARTVRERTAPGAAVAVVAGRGNNGGDGLVAARFLPERRVTVHLLGRPESLRTAIARENWTALERSAADARVVRDSAALELGDPDLVVDAMLGTGAAGALREPEATAAAATNRSGAAVVSVDVPSGVDPDTGEAAGGTVAADHIVTFHDLKPGLAALEATVTVADIGIPAAAETFVGPGDLLALERRPDSHKGDHGEVLVVGGGPYTGAPALAARAAMRAGADLVRVACPRTVAREVQAFEAGLVVRPFEGERFAPESVPTVADLAADHDAVVLGPGLGDADPTRRAVREFLEGYRGTAVVDADALRVVPDVETAATLVCTPHAGELRAMGGDPDADPDFDEHSLPDTAPFRGAEWRPRAEALRGLAAELGVTLLLKGRYDLITDGEDLRGNRTGNPGMTVGGTGDVLAGATGALACVLDPLEAAAVGAYATGRAGDRADPDGGPGLLASDLLGELPAALRDPEVERG